MATHTLAVVSLPDGLLIGRSYEIKRRHASGWFVVCGFCMFYLVCGFWHSCLRVLSLRSLREPPFRMTMKIGRAVVQHLEKIPFRDDKSYCEQLVLFDMGGLLRRRL